jgi:peptidoglycan/LPS O-acetylase OafA/YrhL
VELFSYPSARSVGLFAGSAVALSLGSRPDSQLVRRLGLPEVRWGVAMSGVLFLATASLAAEAHWVDADLVARWLVPLACPFFAVAVLMLWHGPSDPLARALSWGPVAYVGRISYGMYIFNGPMHYLTWSVLLAGLEGWPRLPKYGLRLCVYFGLTVGLASASYFLVEKRFLVLKDRLR